LTIQQGEYLAVRKAIASIPGDVSNDAVGAYAPKLNDIYAPETHAAALDPATPIVVGSRGTGKSFWAGVLGQQKTRETAAKAYPRLGLKAVRVAFGYTGVAGPEGIGIDALNHIIPANADADQAKAFWWATILRAAAHSTAGPGPKLSDFVLAAVNWEARETLLLQHENQLSADKKTLLVVYDALDTVATTWPRQRLITEALLAVVWAMRAYRAIKIIGLCT